jgi:predicted CoA-binding protein
MFTGPSHAVELLTARAEENDMSLRFTTEDPPHTSSEDTHMHRSIDSFFSDKSFAVVGVSADRKKFGNKIYRAMKERGLTVYPVNPHANFVEGDTCYPSVLNLPDTVHSIVLVVKPEAVMGILKECRHKGIDSVWMQPGSESPAAVAAAALHGIQVIQGRCILMYLEPVRSIHALHRWVEKLTGAYPA